MADILFNELPASEIEARTDLLALYQGVGEVPTRQWTLDQLIAYLNGNLDFVATGAAGDMTRTVYDPDLDGRVAAADHATNADTATSATSANAISGAPAASNYYGTDSGGIKGFHPLPSGGGAAGADMVLFRSTTPGAAITLDLDAYNAFYLSLNANITITLSGTLSANEIGTWALYIVTNGFTVTFANRWNPNNEVIGFDTGVEKVNVLTIEGTTHYGTDIFEVERIRSEDWPVRLPQTNLTAVFPFTQNEDANTVFGGGLFDLTPVGGTGISGGTRKGMIFDGADDYIYRNAALFDPNLEWTVYLELQLGAAPIAVETIFSLGHDTGSGNVRLERLTTGGMRVTLVDNTGTTLTATVAAANVPTGRSRWRLVRDNLINNTFYLTNMTNGVNGSVALGTLGTMTVNRTAFGANYKATASGYWAGTIYATVAYATHVTSSSEENTIIKAWFDRNRGLA